MCLSTRARYQLKVQRLIGKGALDGKELFTIEGSENWRSTPDYLEEREKWPKKDQKTTIAAPSLLRPGMSTNSGNELCLRHLHSSRDPASPHVHKDVHNSKNCTCGTTTTINKDIDHLVRALQLRNLHSFLLCHDPAPSNHLEDVLWHWSTICSPKNKMKPNTKICMICGTGTPRSSPRAKNGLQQQGRQRPCRRTARPHELQLWNLHSFRHHREHGHVNNLVQELPHRRTPRTALNPHHPGAHFGASGRRPTLM